MAHTIVVAACGIATVFLMACRQAPPQSDPAHVNPGRYASIGSGHLLRAVSGDGKYLTLEDGSQWEVLPSDQFEAADWQIDAVMSVTATRGENGFDYQLLNTTDDESVAAKFISRH